MAEVTATSKCTKCKRTIGFAAAENDGMCGRCYDAGKAGADKDGAKDEGEI